MESKITHAFPGVFQKPVHESEIDPGFKSLFRQLAGAVSTHAVEAAAAS